MVALNKLPAFENERGFASKKKYHCIVYTHTQTTLISNTLRNESTINIIYVVYAGGYIGTNFTFFLL